MSPSSQEDFSDSVPEDMSPAGTSDAMDTDHEDGLSSSESPDTNQQATVNGVAHTTTKLAIRASTSPESREESRPTHKRKRAVSDNGSRSPKRNDRELSAETRARGYRLRKDDSENVVVSSDDSEEDIPATRDQEPVRSRNLGNTGRVTRGRNPPAASSGSDTETSDSEASSSKRIKRPSVPRNTVFVPGTAEQRRLPTTFPEENPFPDVIRRDYEGNEYPHFFQNRRNFDEVDHADINRYKKWYSQVWGRRDGAINERRQRRTQEEYDDWKQRLLDEKKTMAEDPPKKSKRGLPWPWKKMVDEHNAKFDGRVFPKGTPYARTDDSEANANNGKRNTTHEKSTEEEVFQKRKVGATKVWISRCSELNDIKTSSLPEEPEEDEASDSETPSNPIAERAAENGFGGIYDPILGTSRDRVPRVPNVRGPRSRYSIGRNPFRKDEEQKVTRHGDEYEGLDSDPALQHALAESINAAHRAIFTNNRIPSPIEMEPEITTDMEIEIHAIILNFRSSWPLWTERAERQANIIYAMAAEGDDLEDIRIPLNMLASYLDEANVDNPGTEVVVDVEGGNTVRQQRFKDAEAGERIRQELEEIATEGMRYEEDERDEGS